MLSQELSGPGNSRPVRQPRDPAWLTWATVVKRDDADAMAEDEVAKLLTENLEDEKAALWKIQNIGKRLAKDGAIRVF